MRTLVPVDNRYIAISSSPVIFQEQNKHRSSTNPYNFSVKNDTIKAIILNATGKNLISQMCFSVLLVARLAQNHGRHTCRSSSTWRLCQSRRRLRENECSHQLMQCSEPSRDTGYYKESTHIPAETPLDLAKSCLMETKRRSVLETIIEDDWGDKGQGIRMDWTWRMFVFDPWLHYSLR